MKILFVCTANVCRSFAAERLLSAECTRQGAASAEVKSCGVSAQPHIAPPRQVLEFLSRRGADPQGHKPQLAQEALVDWADLILVMENFHYDIMAEKFPQSTRKMHLLLDYCRDTDGCQLPDPIGGTEKDFEYCLGTILEAVRIIAGKIGGKGR